MKLAAMVFRIITLFLFMGLISSETLCGLTENNKKLTEQALVDVQNWVLSDECSQRIFYYRSTIGNYTTLKTMNQKIAALNCKVEIVSKLQEDVNLLDTCGELRYKKSDSPIEKMKKLAVSMYAVLVSKVVQEFYIKSSL